MNTNLWC